MALIYWDVIFLISVAFCWIQYVDAGAPCRTPKNETGECILLQECTPLYDIIQYKRPLTWTDVNLLRKSNCGFDGEVPKVCCPPFFTGAILQTQVSTNASTPQSLISSQKPFTGNISTSQTLMLSQKPIGMNTSMKQPPNASQKPFINQKDGLGDNYTSNLFPDHTICGPVTNNEIYRGQRTGLDEFPWMALIEYEKTNKKRGFHCTGSLITKRYVLTTSHCIKGRDLPRLWKLVSVRLGEYDTESAEDCIVKGSIRKCNEPALDVPVAERIVHEQYDPYNRGQYHDIALLRLGLDVQFTDFIKPICLPLAKEIREKTYTGSKLTVAGWGKTNNKRESNIKLKLEISGKSLNDCKSVYSAATIDIKDSQLCAGGEEGKDSCRGDSGGPLMTLFTDKIGDINWYAAGIISFGPSPCGKKGWPGVHTQVSKYLPWIVSKIRE